MNKNIHNIRRVNVSVGYYKRYGKWILKFKKIYLKNTLGLVQSNCSFGTDPFFGTCTQGVPHISQLSLKLG